MKDPKEIAHEKLAGKESGSLDNIDKERGDPGRDSGDASLKPQEDGDRSHEKNRAPSPGSTPVLQVDKLKADRSGKSG